MFKVHDIGLGSDFMGMTLNVGNKCSDFISMTLKAQVTKVKIDKGNIKLKSFCITKGNNQQSEKATCGMGENNISKKLMSKIYKDLTKLERNKH